jgi:hypothetical protein
MTTENELEQLRYPIGKRQYNGGLSQAELSGCLSDIGSLPALLTMEVEHLTAEQLDTPYRPGGWTLRQLVHHLCDSHMNAFIRFKLALTETSPVIKPYAEALWADMADCRIMPVQPGLSLINALHQRWMVLLNNLKPADLQRTYVHPEYGKVFTLEEAISLYAWHCRHHLAHITGLKKRNNWQ